MPRISIPASSFNSHNGYSSLLVAITDYLRIEAILLIVKLSDTYICLKVVFHYFIGSGTKFAAFLSHNKAQAQGLYSQREQYHIAAEVMFGN